MIAQLKKPSMTNKNLHNGAEPYEIMLELSHTFTAIFNSIKPNADINECTVRIILETGEVCFLASNPNFHHEFSKQLKSSKKRLPTIRNLQNYKKPGIYLLSAEADISQGMGNSLIKTREKYDMNHALTIVNLFKSQLGNAILLCTLSTSKANLHIYRFYLNHQNKIKVFMSKLTRHLDELIQRPAFIKPNTDEIKLTKEAFKRFQLSEKQQAEEDKPLQNTSNITQREKEVIHWYIKGKSAEQTAKILGIATGTVRTHFERLKAKLGCYYKPQIIIKLINSGLIQPDDNDPSS